MENNHVMPNDSSTKDEQLTTIKAHFPQLQEKLVDHVNNVTLLFRKLHT